MRCTIPDHYTLLTRLINQSWFFRSDDVNLYHVDLLAATDEPAESWPEQKIADSFCQAPEAQDTEAIEMLLAKLQLHICRQCKTVSEAKALLLSLFLSICKYINQCFPEYFLQSEYYPEQITLTNSLQNALNLVRSLCIQTIEVLEQNNVYGVCQLLLQYIEHNYSQPLRLKDLAYKFGYDSAYLGKLLKKTPAIPLMPIWTTFVCSMPVN